MAKVMVANDDDRFYALDFDNHDHLADLVKSVVDGEIDCIVDEDAGGIVAYVISPEGYHRTNEFVAALVAADKGSE